MSHWNLIQYLIHGNEVVVGLFIAAAVAAWVVDWRRARIRHGDDLTDSTDV